MNESHSDETPHSVGLLWTRDRSVAERYLTTHDIHQTAMSPSGFEPVILASERPQTYALYRAASGVDIILFSVSKIRSRTALWR